MSISLSTRPASVRCRAKNPATCREHGRPNVQQQAADLQNKISAALTTQTAVEPKTASHQLVDRALTTSLQWSGEKPVWWEKYAAEAENNEIISTSAELIDVIDSPAGPLAVVWQNESQQRNDMGVSLGSGYGVNICYYKSFETGETLGYIKASYMDDETMERTFGTDEFTPFRVRDRYSGLSYSFEKNDDKTYGERVLQGQELLEKRRSVWVSYHKDVEKSIVDSDGKYIAYYNINENCVPADEQVAKDLNVARRKLKKEMKERQNFFSTPFIDFSKVEEPLKGKGFGTALYVYTARVLGQRGKVLRGSGIQSEDAQKAWDGFKRKFPQHVSVMKRKYNGREYIDPVLDFR